MNDGALNMLARVSVGYTVRVDCWVCLSVMLVDNASCFTNWLLQVQFQEPLSMYIYIFFKRFCLFT